MTNAELADHLNAEAGLTGRDAVTSNVIRQWVAWDVLPKATPFGRTIGQNPTWVRSQTEMRRAKRLAELRKFGVKRETALIVQAYIEWGHPDFERTRNALAHEIAKWRSQITRKRTTYIAHGDYKGLSTVQQRAFRTQSGPLDGRFTNTLLQQSGEFVATFIGLAETGQGNFHLIRDLLSEAIDRILPGFGGMAAIIPIEMISSFIAGTFGEPDEISDSAQAEVEIGTEREYRIARVFTRRVLNRLSQTKRVLTMQDLPTPIVHLSEVLDNIIPQISTGPWVVFHLTQWIMLIRRSQLHQNIGINVLNLDKLIRDICPESL